MSGWQDIGPVAVPGLEAEETTQVIFRKLGGHWRLADVEAELTKI